jgi:hypothetical protein
MAYLFNQVDDSEEKKNIFAPQAGAQGQEAGQTGGDNVQKGNTSTSISDSPSSGSGQSTSSPAAPKAQGGYNPAAASSAYKSAAASIKMPSAGLNRAEGALAAGSQALQDKSNAYQTKAADTAKGYQLDDSTLSGAVQGTDADFQKTAQRLSSKSPGLFESFSGLGADQPNVENVRDTGNLYREEVGPSYTAGQSRLDSAMLRQNPEFLARQQAILGQQKQLQAADTKAQTDQTKTARDMLGKQYGESTDDIRRRLGVYGDEVVTTAKGLSAAEEARRAAIDPNKIGQNQQQDIKNKIEEDLKHADPHSEQYRSLKFLADQYDLGSHVKVDKEVDWREMLNEGQAGRFNRAQGLLGNAETLQAGKGPGEAYSFDQAGAYKNILAQLQGKRQTADQADRERMAAIQAEAQGRVAGTQKSLREQYEAMLPDYQKMLNQQPFDTGGLDTSRYGNRVDTNQVAIPAYQDQAVDWQSMLTPEEISEMNSVQADLGTMNPTDYNTVWKDYNTNNNSIAAQIAAWKAKQPAAAAPVQPAKPVYAGRGQTRY